MSKELQCGRFKKLLFANTSFLLALEFDQSAPVWGMTQWPKRASEQKEKSTFQTYFHIVTHNSYISQSSSFNKKSNFQIRKTYLCWCITSLLSAFNSPNVSYLVKGRLLVKLYWKSNFVEKSAAFWNNIALFSSFSICWKIGSILKQYCSLFFLFRAKLLMSQVDLKGAFDNWLIFVLIIVWSLVQFIKQCNACNLKFCRIV